MITPAFEALMTGTVSRLADTLHVSGQLLAQTSTQGADPTAVTIIRTVGFIAMGVGLLIIALRIWRNRR